MTQPARPDDKLIDRYAQAIAHDDVTPAPHIRNAVLMYAAAVVQQRKDAASAQPVRDADDEEFPLQAANAPRWRTWAAASVAVTAIAGVLGWQFTKLSQPADTLAMPPHQGKAEQVATAPSPAPALTPAQMQNAAAEKATSVAAITSETSASSLPAEPPKVAAATISRNETLPQPAKANPQSAPRQAETKLAQAALPPPAITPRPAAAVSTKPVATIAAAPPAPTSPSREVLTGAPAASTESAKTVLASDATSASGAGSASSTHAAAAPAAAARVAAAPLPVANNTPAAVETASPAIAAADKPASDSKAAGSASPPAAGSPASAAEQRARLLASLGRPAHEADPEQWWAHITQLRSKGRVKEADIELIRLRDRYPVFKLPARASSEAEAAEPASASPPPQR